MTKTEAKKLIKEHYDFEINVHREKIVDWNIWKDELDGQYMFNIITVSENHIPYKHAGYFEDGKIIDLEDSSGLLITIR